MKYTHALLLAFAALAVSGCKRQNAPAAKRIVLSETGGCILTLPHPKTGEFACWGQIPGDTEVTDFPKTRAFPFGIPTDFAMSKDLACAVKDNSDVYCWSATDPSPKKTEDVGKEVSVGVGAGHVCVRADMRLRCFGDDTHGQLGKPDAWNKNVMIRSVALGPTHTCAAYEGLGVVCSGEGPAVGDAKALASLDVTMLAAGEAHTCAVLSSRTVKCWGKNDSGQLGDRTTNDSAVGVPVLGLDSVARISAGARHTCALRGDGTVHCWGNNTKHQLANGGTKNDGRAQMVLGVLGVAEISAAGDATCARFGSNGEVRCWGDNSKKQLGDGSTVEHTVPAALKFH